MDIQNGSGRYSETEKHPTVICRFLNIVIKIYYNEGIHSGRPHFHVVFRDRPAVSIDIETLEELSETKLPPGRRGKLIRKWARKNREGLMEDWDLARDGKEMKQLKPPRH